jgi:hypothetical protein
MRGASDAPLGGSEQKRDYLKGRNPMIFNPSAEIPQKSSSLIIYLASLLLTSVIFFE